MARGMCSIRGCIQLRDVMSPRAAPSRSLALRAGRRAVALLLGGVATLTACTGNRVPDEDDPLPAIEREFRARFAATSIALEGAVLDEEGAPLVGATATFGDARVRSDAGGRFVFETLPRRTRLLTVAAEGYRTERIAVHLHLPLHEERVTLDPVLLARPAPNETRFLFAGDTSLGRRFVSPNAEAPLDRIPPADPEALIPSDDAAAGAARVVRGMKPIFEVADYRTLNLETVVTDTPETPYKGKPYVFFTLPDALAALHTLDVGFVSLGNNHMYDYLERGVTDTLRHVASRGVGSAGAGPTAIRAYKPFRIELGGVPYSMISASSIVGDQYDTLFVANDEKGGAANAADSTHLAQTIVDELAAGRSPIVHLHAGAEYTDRPVSSAHDRMRFAVESGAALVVAHHPHVPEGFEWYQERLIAHSLGNFVFDQDRLETVLGQLLRVDVSGASVRHARSIPIFIEDFQPRPIAGAVADLLLRRIGAASLPYGGLVFPYLHQGFVVRPGEARVRSETIEVPVVIDEEGFGIIDLRGRIDSRASVARVEMDAPGIRARIGRDIMLFGDMEDVDVDDDMIETSRWWYSNSSSFPCMHSVRRGAVALCSQRDWDDTGESVIAFRYRIRVQGHAEDAPEKDLTLLAYTQADNAGPVTLDVRYYASEGTAEFGKEVVLNGVRGSWNWRPVVRDLNMPADDPERPTSKTQNPRALRVFVTQTAPKRGHAMVRLDDVAVISWEESIPTDGSEELAVPHPRDFIRFEGPPGEHVVRVLVKTLLPR